MVSPTIETDRYALYCADAMDVLPTHGPVNAVITSPPYNLGSSPWPHLGNWKPGDASGSGGKSKWRNGSDASAGIKYRSHADTMPWPEYVAWQRGVLSALWQLLPRDGAIFYNHKPRVIGAKLWTPTELVPAEVIARQIIVWARPGGLNFNPTAFVPTHEWIMLLAKESFRLKSKGVSGFGDVWRMAPDKNDHPAPFPLELPAKAIDALKSTATTIMDPFMGSGTTGVAAMNAGRFFVGVEKDPAYFKIAAHRIAEAASQATETTQTFAFGRLW